MFSMMKPEELVLKMVGDGQLPTSLYKYRSLSNGSKEYTLDIFRKCELYFSAPSAFNDPFDCKLPPSIASKEMLAETIAQKNSLEYKPEDVKSAVLVDNDFFARFETAVNNVMNRHGVCCFSRKNADILMWSHYGDCHQGVCLEFDVTLDPNFFVFPMNIRYQDVYPKIDVSGTDGIGKYTTALLSTKFSAWSYEQEVRVYKTSHHTFPFNPAALKSVCFGCKADEGLIEEVKQAIGENDALKHVRFYKTVMDHDAYKLNIVDLS